MLIRAAVLIVALAGIAATIWMLSDSPPATEQEVDAMRQIGSEATAEMQLQLEQELAGRVASEEQTRLDSPLGQALSRRCVDWSDLEENHPSPETAENRDRACEQLRIWVRDGIAPERSTSP